MWPFKRKKEQLSYAEEHNRAFGAYKKAAMIGIWSGVLNVFGLLIAITQISQTNSFSLFLCYGSVDFLICLMMGVHSIISSPLFYILSFVIAAAVSSGFILLSVFATQGKKISLYIMSGLYLLDLMFILPLGLMGLETLGNILLSIVVHVVIIAFLLIAIYQYDKIVKIAIKHGILKEKR